LSARLVEPNQAPNRHHFDVEDDDDAIFAELEAEIEDDDKAWRLSNASAATALPPSWLRSQFVMS